MTKKIGRVTVVILHKIKELLCNARLKMLQWQHRRIMMKKEDLGNVLSTQLIECISNKKYGYMSSVGAKHSHLTEEGRALMIELIEQLVPIAQQIHEKDIKNRAEQMMIDVLKS